MDENRNLTNPSAEKKEGLRGAGPEGVEEGVKNKAAGRGGLGPAKWVVEEGSVSFRHVLGVDGLPIAAEVLRDPGRELESDAEPAALEEDVGVLQLT